MSLSKTLKTLLSTGSIQENIITEKLLTTMKGFITDVEYSQASR